MKPKSKLGFFALIVMVLTISTSSNGQKIFKNDTIMNLLPDKKTLTTLEINNKQYYLSNIGLMQESESNKKIGNGDYFISFTIISGDYPKMYSKSPYFMHIIPEENHFRFTYITGTVEFYENGSTMTGHGHSVCPLSADDWMVGGTSEDKNSLFTKVFEYYVNNATKLNGNDNN